MSAQTSLFKPPTPPNPVLKTTLSILSVGVLIATFNYFLSRSLFLLFVHYTLIEKVLALLFFSAEIFVMIQTIGFFSTLLRVHRSAPLPMPPDWVSPADAPGVAILIPARHEPKEVLENTVISCYNLDYPNKAIYILDDSSETQFKEEAAVIGREYEALVFKRDERRGAKAGILNDILRTLHQKYIVIFDCDQNPMPHFLTRTIPVMEEDDRLAFVQTPQFYTNGRTNRIAYTANVQQAVFYEYICEGKTRNDSMICCGTNVVIRREALLEIGGFDESSVTEDFATSFRLQLKGWKTRYFPHVAAFGMGPEDLGNYFKQQFRWARGNVGMLPRLFITFLKSPRALAPHQWFEYFITSSYFLIGICYGFLTFCPMTYIFFNVPSFFMNATLYAGTFAPYLILSIGVFYSSMMSRGYHWKDILKAQAINFISIPIYGHASLLGILGIRATFHITQKTKGKCIPYLSLWPILALWVLTLVSLTWSVNRMIYETLPSIWLNVFWLVYHFSLLSSIFYFNEID